LVKDYVAVANDVSYGNASTYGQVTQSTSARVEVTSPLSVTPLFLSEEAVLPARSVFTVFMLSSGTGVTGILRRER
jgi:translation initiation factor RLI1